MKTKNNLKIAFYLLFAVIVTSCFKKETLSDVSVIKSDKNTEALKTDFDKYLDREFVKPYNITIEYKLNDIQTNFDNYVVPASKEKSIKMANLIKYLCLEAYEKHTNKNFLKKYFPKTIVFVGSGAYSGAGTVILGTAEGGVKIVLYDINNMNPKNINHLTERYFNTIFHEFSHILHQKKMFSTDFEQISAKDYVGDEWNRFWRKKKSISKGFISNYSSKEPQEDFVEIISRYLTNDEKSWKKRINPDGKNKEGEIIINKKLNFVKVYLRDNWNINLDNLKEEVIGRYANLDLQDLDNIK